MSKELEYLPITDLLTKIIDNRGKSVPTVDKGFPLIATNCIKQSSIYPTFDKVRYIDETTLKSWFRAHLKPNDILFVNKGTPGRVCLVPNPVTFCAAQDMMGFRCNPDLINYKYLFAVLRSKEIQKKIENNHVGLVIPHFRKQELSSLLIPLKSLHEQELIGNLYITLSEKIELNNRINSELEAIAKTLYDYWFVQFDFPDENGRPYKSSGGKMVWNKELKRKIPEDWLVKTIGDYAEVKKGDLITAKDAHNGEIKVIAAGVDFSYKHNEYNRLENTITISGSGANAGYINFWREPIFASDCITVRGANDAETLLILHYLKFIQHHILGQATGSAQPHVYPSDIKILNYIVPIGSLIKQFGNLVIPMNKQIAVNLKENQQLSSLRDWLLPMLMNGQVKVKDTVEETLLIAAEKKVEFQ